MNTQTLPSYPRDWQRYTVGQRLLRFALYLLFILAIVQSARTVDAIPEFLDSALAEVGHLLSRMWPVHWGSVQGDISRALIDTLHLARLRTLLAIVLAVPVGLLAANNLPPNRWRLSLARLILLPSRSI